MGQFYIYKQVDIAKRFLSSPFQVYFRFKAFLGFNISNIYSVHKMSILIT